MGADNKLIRDFERENNTLIDDEKKIEQEEKIEEISLEL